MFRFFKKIRVLFAAALFSLSLAFPAFAEYTVNSGTIQPCTYVFDLALHASGVSVDPRTVDQWFLAYQFYLDKCGSSSARSGLTKLKALSWGDTYSDTEAKSLVSDVSGWLDSCQIETFRALDHVFSPMNTPQPLDWATPEDPFSVQTTPYSFKYMEGNHLVSSGDFTYLFSTMCYGSDYIWRKNCYVPNGTEVFALMYSNYIYQNYIGVKFYQKDTSSSTGYSECPIYYFNEWYDQTTHERVGGNGSAYYYTFTNTYISSKYLSVFPFPVIINSSYISLYLNGTYYPAAKDGYFSCLYGGIRNEIRNREYVLDSVGAIQLPASATEAESNLSVIHPGYTRNSSYVRGQLKSGADWTIEWVPWSYEVGHYFDGELLETETLSVSPDENTVSEVPLLEKEGYRLNSSPYSPALPTEITPTNNTISVAYESWSYPYTVNYYYDGILKDSVSLSVPSYDNTVTEVSLLEKEGYRLNSSPYSPALPTKITPTNNTISVAYESWSYPYTVNYYFDNLLKDSVSLSVPSYDNVVSEVPLLSSSMYQLREAPYSPDLPVTITDTQNVINVSYYSPMGNDITNGLFAIVGSLKEIAVRIIPYALGVVLFILVLLFGIRFYTRIVKKN